MLEPDRLYRFRVRLSDECRHTFVGKLLRQSPGRLTLQRLTSEGEPYGRFQKDGTFVEEVKVYVVAETDVLAFKPLVMDLHYGALVPEEKLSHQHHALMAKVRKA